LRDGIDRKVRSYNRLCDGYGGTVWKDFGIPVDPNTI
jgi:hypothetical protein